MNKKNPIVTVDIDQCYPNEYNSNRMSDLKFEALIETIKRHGQTHPIQVVPGEDGKYRIVGGEHKWRAMKALKFKEVDIMVRDFEDEIEEQLGSIEDNIHGNSIPVREAMIIASATGKYSIAKLRKRLGEEESELRDKLLLVKDDEKIKQVADSMNTDHFVELDFIVDINPEHNADRLIKEIGSFAKTIGARLVKHEFKKSKSKESVAILLFNVSESQRNVIEDAINLVSKEEDVNKATALEYISAEFLAGTRKAKKAEKLSPKKVQGKPSK